MTYLWLDISENELEGSDIFDRTTKKLNYEKPYHDIYNHDIYNNLIKVWIYTEGDMSWNFDIIEQAVELGVDDVKESEITEIIIKKLINFGYSDGLDPEEKKYIIELAKHVPLSDEEVELLFRDEPKEIILDGYRERVIYIVLAISLATKDWVITKQEKDRLMHEARLLGFNKEMLIVIWKLIDSMTTIQEQKTAIEFYATELEARNNEIKAQSEEIKTQAEALFAKNELLEEQKASITASIEYAKYIQEAILPQQAEMIKLLQEYFVLYMPKDIVSGDFYWIKEQEHRTLVTAADCTWHGVPWAFMSVLWTNLLNAITEEEWSEQFSPWVILDKLRSWVKVNLKEEQATKAAQNGMDMALISLEKNTKEAIWAWGWRYSYLEYAGAYNPLYVIRNAELVENVRATRAPVGAHLSEKPFKTTRIQLEKWDMLYMFSDGYIDQFGWDDGKKLRAKKFKEILLIIADKPEKEQKAILKEVFGKWKGNREQIDDVIVMWIRI